jgi:hypothetical protein
MATYIPPVDWAKVNQAIWYQVGSQTDDAVYTTGVITAIQGPAPPGIPILVAVDNTLLNPTDDGTGVYIEGDAPKTTVWLDVATVRVIQYSTLSSAPVEPTVPATTTAANYTQPAIDTVVIVPIAWQTGYVVGQIINVEGGGNYILDQALEPNLTLRNRGDVTNVTEGTVILAGAIVTVGEVT